MPALFDPALFDPDLFDTGTYIPPVPPVYSLGPAIWGQMRWGWFRWGIAAVPPILSQVFARLKAAFGSSLSVVWQERMEGAVDVDTGKPTFTFLDHDIEVFVQNLNTGQDWLPSGVMGTDQIKIHCLEGVKLLDHLVWKGRVWEVKSPPQEYRIGDLFVYRLTICERLKTE